jgi:hypothetical protein
MQQDGGAVPRGAFPWLSPGHAHRDDLLPTGSYDTGAVHRPLFPDPDRERRTEPDHPGPSDSLGTSRSASFMFHGEHDGIAPNIPLGQ